MARKLSPEFLKDLKNGELKELLRYVQNDNSMDLQIREDNINIYYSGGSILKVEKKKRGYSFHFEKKYLKYSNNLISERLIDQMNKMDWLDYIPLAKQAMDFYFSKSRKEEREFQQLVVRENNFSSLSNGTDYFIIDIEYDNKNGARFDLVALEWLSNITDRKLSPGHQKPTLVVMEMKFGDKSLSGSASMQNHWDDYLEFIQNKNGVKEFKKEMLTIFNQKRELGLIPDLNTDPSLKRNKNVVESISDDLEFVYLLANHDHASTKLKKELDQLNSDEIKIMTSNFLGYGLFAINKYPLSVFKSNFKRQIHS